MKLSFRFSLGWSSEPLYHWTANPWKDSGIWGVINFWAIVCFHTSRRTIFYFFYFFFILFANLEWWDILVWWARRCWILTRKTFGWCFRVVASIACRLCWTRSCWYHSGFEPGRFSALWNLRYPRTRQIGPIKSMYSRTNLLPLERSTAKGKV